MAASVGPSPRRRAQPCLLPIPALWNTENLGEKKKKREQKENTRPARSLLPAFTASRRLAGGLALCVERRPRRRERSQKSPAEGR